MNQVDTRKALRTVQGTWEARGKHNRYHHHHRITTRPQRGHCWSSKGRNLDFYADCPDFQGWQLIKSVNVTFSKCRRPEEETRPLGSAGCASRPPATTPTAGAAGPASRAGSSVLPSSRALPGPPGAEVGGDGEGTGQRGDDTAHVGEEGQVVLVHGVHLHGGHLGPRDRVGLASASPARHGGVPQMKPHPPNRAECGPMGGFFWGALWPPPHSQMGL